MNSDMTKRTALLLSLGVVLLTTGLVSAVTVTGQGNDPALQFAAKDLERILAGVDGTIAFETEASLRSQEWRLRTAADGRLVVSGRDAMGIVYGVYSLLERHFGCAWLAPDTEIVPDMKGRVLPKLDETGRPAYLYREFYVGMKDHMDDYWRLRNKESYRTAFGVGVRHGNPGDCHTFGWYARKLEKTHPELFGTKPSAAKGPCRTLCMTDPVTQRLVADEMLKLIDADFAAAADKPSYCRPSYYDLSQDDGPSGFECLCDGCKALAEAEGTYAAPNLAFVNAVADIVCAKHPELMIQTFAYAYTEKPPKTLRASSNVIVRVCNAGIFRPYRADSENGEVLEAWSHRASHLYIWGYWRTYQPPLDPCVMPRTQIAEDLRYARACGADRYFAEDEDPLSRNFAMLQHWLFLKLSEDPSADVGALSTKFFCGYYGAAAGTMERLLTMLETRQDEKRTFLDRDYFERAHALLDEAERLVSDDDRLLRHVRWERLVTDRAFFNRIGLLSQEGYSPDVKGVAKRFAALYADQLKHWTPLTSRKDLYAKRVEAAKNEMSLYLHYPIAIPERFAGRQVEDIQWTQFRFCATCYGDRKSELRFEDDPDACAGRAFYNGFAKLSLPLKVGFYNQTPKEGEQIQLKAEDIPQDEKFHLYHLGRQLIAPGIFVYFDASWLMYGYLPISGIVPEERDIWISAKITGPTFVKGSTKPDRILFDRVLLVK